MMRYGLGLVDKYSLGQAAGYGALIAQADVNTLGQYVQRHPEYSDIKDDEELDADG